MPHVMNITVLHTVWVNWFALNTGVSAWTGTKTQNTTEELTEDSRHIQPSEIKMNPGTLLPDGDDNTNCAFIKANRW